MTIKANKVVFGTKCEFFYNDKANFVGLGIFSSRELGERLDDLAGESVLIEFRTVTDKQEQAKDVKKFSKRLDVINDKWSVGEWHNLIIDGHVMNTTFQCEIKRK